MSGVPRSAITGIINGSLQKISINRLIRILGTLGKTAEFKVKKAALKQVETKGTLQTGLSQ